MSELQVPDVQHLTGGCGCWCCTVALPEIAELLAFARREMKAEIRGLRTPRPTPREGVEAGLTLLVAAIENSPVYRKERA